MDVERSIAGHSASQKMLSVHNKMSQPDDDEPLLEEHEELIEGDDGYQLTELKNVNVSNKKNLLLGSLEHIDELEELTGQEGELEEDLQDSLSQEIKMSINLVHTVYHYPALYDENDSSYHSKSYRNNAWRKIAQTLMWQGDIGSLQREWMQLKERYEKVVNNKASPDEDDYQQLWDEMKWLDSYLGRHGQRVILGHPPSSQAQSHVGQRDSFYSDPSQTVAEDVMISGYRQPPPQSSSGHRTVSSLPSSSGQSGQGEVRSSGNGSGNGGYYLLKNSNSSQGHIRLVSENQHVPSSARVTVLPATRTSNGTAVVQLPPGNYPRNQRVQIIHTPNSGQNGSYDHRVNVGDPGVTVTERGTVPRGLHVVKKELIEQGEYYTTSGPGEPKLYRIIPSHSDMHPSQAMGAGPSPTKRMRIIRPQNSNQQVQMIQMTPSTSRHSIPMNTLEDEVVIEDGVEDVPPESPLMSESPGIGSMISGSNFQTGLGAGSPSSHPGYLQQAQYDADLQFQQLISSSLARLDDNEKAIVKFHIQRILLENRYGSGITKSLIQDDELDVGSNGVPHELVSQ